MAVVLVRLAVRNVFRHPRRTVITTAAVALAVVFMTVAAGFLDFTFWGLRQSIVYAGEAHASHLAGTYTVDDTYDLVSAAPAASARLTK